MNERLVPQRKPGGLTGQGLRYLGLAALALGIVGQTILQRQLLGVGSVSARSLLDALADPNNMAVATAALVAQLAQGCAIPLFSFLLVQGMIHTRSFRNYFIRLAAIAVICEVPYDLATFGQVWYGDAQNPVFGLVVAAAAIYFIRRYGEKSFQGAMVVTLVVLVSIFWVAMLAISDGLITVVICMVLWGARNKRWVQTLVGCAVMLLCVLISPLYALAPLAFLAIHFYNGEKGTGNMIVNYAAYPVLLLGVWAVAKLAF